MAGIAEGISHYVTSSDADIADGQFSAILRIPANHNRCCLLSASIPKTYYLIQDAWNTFTFTNAYGTQTITLINGNYSVITFCTMVKAQLAAAFPLVTYTITFNQATGKLSISSAQTFSISVPTAKLQSIMGINSGTHSATYNSPTASYVVTGDNTCTMQCTSLIWILSNLVQSNTPTVPGGTLSHFYTNDNVAFSYITYQNPTPEASAAQLGLQWSPRTELQTFSFNFSIRDDALNLVNFNGLSIDLVIRTWYEPPLYDTLIQYFNARINEIVDQRTQDILGTKRRRLAEFQTAPQNAENNLNLG